jgi:hypothetical protein
MEKRDYCFDYIRGSCDNLKCQYGHVIVHNKEEFLKKHEHRIKGRIGEVKEHTPSFTEIQSKSNPTSNKKISKCVRCQRGFLVCEELIERGDPSSIKCDNCIRRNAILY